MIALVLCSYASGQSASIYTQNPKPAPASDLLKSLEIALVRLEAAERVKGLQAEEINALRGKIEALEGLVKIERERGDAYKRASEERATANALDDKRVALYEQSLLSFREETMRLRSERDSARRANKVWGAVGLILGIGAALWGSK
jgi:hypothetical protein